MAQRVEITLVDDIDGSDATETVIFGLDGKEYSIDLNDKNAKQLRSALEPFITKASSRKRRGGAPAAKSSGPSPAAIREWAQKAGLEVPARGRIPQNVREAYDAAN
jgi:hypothetical protein